MCILLYRDNPAIRDALSMLLGGMPGLKLVGAYPNPLNWHRQLVDKHPDVVLMDIEMPGLDGIEATRAIHAAPEFGD